MPRHALAQLRAYVRSMTTKRAGSLSLTRKRLFGLLVAGCCLAAPAYTQTTYTYWPGFSGTVTQFLVPLDASKADNRYLTLKINLAKAPKASDVAFKSAFHAACQRHRSDLVSASAKVSRHSDWRVKATFQWSLSASNGVTVFERMHRFMWLSNCRAAGD
ncbi:MAG: hypothetical protein AB3N17_03165 [Tateyamaria sp.]